MKELSLALFIACASGPEKGHFGISNMRERAARSGMTLTFGQKRGYVAVTLERRTGT